MYQGLLHAHSGLRWIVIIAIIYAIIKTYSGWKSNRAFTASDRKAALFALIFTHLQLVIGLILYFISPKVAFTEGFMADGLLRFYAVEHLVTMLIGIGIITAGFSTAKRKAEDMLKHKRIAIFYLIGFVVILLGIPWPFRGLGAGWF